MKWLITFCFVLSVYIGLGQPAVGEKPPAISLPDPQGNIVSLQELQGKIVLVDFWASWCGPCRIANRRMQPLYQKFQPKGFEVLGVSVDNEAMAWKKAIAADEIAWLQVHQPGGWEAPVARLWNIEQLPTTFLLDKNGAVLAVDPTMEELRKLLSKLL